MSIDNRIYPESNTRCFCCGHVLEACSDCLNWLRDNSPRIATDWLFWVGWEMSRQAYARYLRALVLNCDAGEDEAIALYTRNRR